MRNGAREDLEREQRAQRQAEDRHEPRALPWTAAVGRHVAGPCASMPPTRAGPADDDREAARVMSGRTA